jgi:hypothetical protein
LIAHLADIELPAIAANTSDRFAKEPAIAVLLKRWDGLRHQAAYLDQLAESQLSPAEDKLRNELLKLDRDVMKYSRPKNAYARFSQEDFDRRFGQRPASLVRSLDRYERAHRTIYVYDYYDRAPIYQDFLWWDLMTDGRINGSAIPDVQEFHESHPDYSYDRDRFLDDEAVAAAAIADADSGADALQCGPDSDPSDTSFSDPS